MDCPGHSCLRGLILPSNELLLITCCSVRCSSPGRFKMRRKYQSLSSGVPAVTSRFKSCAKFASPVTVAIATAVVGAVLVQQTFSNSVCTVGTRDPYCGGPGTSPCDYSDCLAGSGNCYYSNGYDYPIVGTRNVSVSTWYSCYYFPAFFYSCNQGYAPCGVTYDYIDQCVNVCSGAFYWSGCAALQGSVACPQGQQ
jgi:hypothetical protein